MSGIQHLCYWIGGVQEGQLDENKIRETAINVDAMLPPGQYIHKVFNWEDEFDKRQQILWDIGKKYGNWLTAPIKKGKIFIGMDMGWYLSTMRGMMSSFLYGDIHKRLKKEIDSDFEILKNKGFDMMLYLIAHSWGTKFALDFAIYNSDYQVNLITMGSPLLDLAGSYEDWGDPDKIKNIKIWTNIMYPNDPISTAPIYENPGPNSAKWQTFVRDIILPNASFFPLKSHCSYWQDKNCQVEIAKALKL